MKPHSRIGLNNPRFGRKNSETALQRWGKSRKNIINSKKGNTNYAAKQKTKQLSKIMKVDVPGATHKKYTM